MNNKQHHSIKGVEKIVNLKASLNNGLSAELKTAFPNWKAVPVDNLSVGLNSYDNLSPDWVSGFATGESNFFIAVQKAKSKIGFYTSIRFSIAQHSRDILLIKSFVNFFGGGYVTEYKNKIICEFVVSNFNLNFTRIITFFDKYPIRGSKHLDYLDFKKAAQIIQNKQHLNLKVLNKLLI